MDAGLHSRLTLACFVCATLTAVSSGAEPAKPSERDAAARIDAAFRRAVPAEVALPPLATDEAFIRRASLDLTGKLPSAEEVRAFVADTAADKRDRLIDRLLESDAYAANWGRYWRDVVSYHTPASGNYLRWKLYDDWWATQLRRNRPWNEIATALITAEGVNDEQAPVNYLTSMYGNPVEIAATTSRVFLGVQIQCAECHDAKTERWKREQFHELAAFFGRAKIIQHKDVNNRGTPYAIEGRSEGQYLMIDKKEPGRRIAMQPRFLTGESASLDADDVERRAALARVLTSPKNPWFARCYTNRIWSSLMGWGFYPTVIDLGSDHPPRYPEVLDGLAKDFTASGHDMKWLFRTVMRTRAYQSQFQAPPGAASGVVPAVCPVRLRPEQVFENLQKALGFDENDKSIPAPAVTSAPAVQRHSGVRNMVYQAFKENPSTPSGEVHGSIPQALVMMNSALVHTYTAANGKTVLARLIEEKKSDLEIVEALYERTLARKPTEKELDVCKRYLAKVGNREEALEDVLWSLVNSTEFLLKK
jgi:hypothetical protein